MVGILRSFATLGLAVAGLACTPPERPDRATAPIRLVDELSAAQIRSPLEGVPSLETLLKDRVQPPSDVLRKSVCPQCTKSSPGGCLVDSAGAWTCGGESAPFGPQFELPIRSPNTTAILLEGRLRPPGCVGLEIRDDAQRRRMPWPGGATEWHTASVLWGPAPAADRASLRLFRQRIAEPCQVDLRSVSLVELDEDHELSLALMRDRHPSLRGDSGLGLAKFGTFLPLSDAESVVSPFDDNYAAREALLAPVPTDYRFRLRIPRGGRLAFSYGIGRESKIGDEVDFEILAVDADGTEASLWSDRFDLSTDNWHWRRATVPLNDYWGKTAELVLRTRSPATPVPTSEEIPGATTQTPSGFPEGFALWGTPTIEVPRPASDPPNVILIAVDTLRADRLSAYGYPEATSPRIDEFAQQSVLFENAISQSNWTIPAFASIFTGQTVARHRMATFVRRLDPSVETLPELFRQHGWRTDAVLYQPALYQRLDGGFETFFNVPRLNARADDTLHRAEAWLRQARDQRFFLFLHFQDPHQPFTQPEEFVSSESAAELNSLGLRLPLFLPTEYPKCRLCTREGVVTERARTLARGLYDEEIRYVDDRIGRFLDVLRELGLYDSSVIALVSDHGETLWSHYDFYGHGGANLHNELIRVPLIIKPRAGTDYSPGARVRARVRTFDLMPTLLELAGLAPPTEDLDAASLTPLLSSGARAAEPRDRITFSQSAVSAALLLDRWKYILPVGRGVDPGAPANPRVDRELLFDLRDDPEERRDLSEGRPEVLRSLRETTLSYLINTVGGRFLLVQGVPTATTRHLTVTCDPACTWNPLLQFGLERTSSTSTTAVFEGPGLGGGILLFAHLSTVPQATLGVSWASEGQGDLRLTVRRTARCDEAIAGRMHRGPGPEAWLLEAPEPSSSRLGSSTALDSQQEKALRALGYLD